jgi:hypothetical protein
VQEPLDVKPRDVLVQCFTSVFTNI